MKKNKLSPLVSVIMNCHNGEEYLKESINSLMSQTYKNWELIFWDNKSFDNSKKIVKKFKDKRIKYFKSEKFRNLYHSRNLAIKKAKGKYIGFLDVDDLWERTKLKKHSAFSCKTQLEMSKTQIFGSFPPKLIFVSPYYYYIETAEMLKNLSYPMETQL